MEEEAKQLHVRIPKADYTKLKLRCVYESISIQDYIAKLVTEKIRGYSAEENSVLIIDDETIIRESLRDWLKDAYQVATAETSEEALALIGKQDFDILIVDVRLPGKSGIQVLREVKEVKPHIKSIVITAYPSVDMAVESMKLGAIDYLVKPVAPDYLERLIRENLVRRKSE